VKGVAAFVALLLATTPLSSQAAPSAGKLFSARGEAPDTTFPTRVAKARPFRIVAGKDDLYFAGPSPVRLHVVYSSENLVEVVRAPDGASFAVNISDGGLVGSWRFRVFQVDAGGHPREISIRRVLAGANRLPLCDEPESPNLAVSAWLSADRLLVVAQAPPHSSCRNMGAIKGFVVDIPRRRLVARLSEHDLCGPQWAGYLGPMLQSSP
jgi:hypothetical protein